MSQPPDLDVFAQLPRRLVTSLSGAMVTVSHVSSRQFDPDALFGAAPEDGFALVYRLADMPAHDFWNDDGYSRVQPTAKGTLQIVDLAGGANSRFESGFDNLHVSIPRLALAALAEQVGAAPVRTLAVPDTWETRDPMFAVLAPSFLCALQHPDAVAPLVVDHLLQAMLAHVAATYGGMQRLSTNPPGALQPHQIARAKELLSADLTAAPSMADVAREIGTLPSHFSRGFKAATGVSPSAWLLRYRVEQAMTLLRTSDLPLVDIAMLSGFSDQSHFTRTFTKWAGIAPGAWRRQGR